MEIANRDRVGGDSRRSSRTRTAEAESEGGVMETTDIRALRGMADKMHEHARNCKKPIDRCEACRFNIAFFGELSPATLSAVLEERRVG